jgi:hypothetical protein
LSLDAITVSKTVREWVKGLNEAVLGEVGISWEKYHKVIDQMKVFVQEIEKRLEPEAGSF